MSSPNSAGGSLKRVAKASQHHIAAVTPAGTIAAGRHRRRGVSGGFELSPRVPVQATEAHEDGSASGRLFVSGRPILMS
jgi:hypothetical protein